MSFEGEVRDYFEGWNQHRSDLVTGLFSKEGTFEDPTLRIVSSREPASDISAAMNALVSVFPDFRFEIQSTALNPDRAFVEWILRGTNTMPWKPGIDATGRTVHLRGVEVINDAPGGFSHVTRYFDQKSLCQQIGLQVIVEPIIQGKATYGYSKRVTSGNLHRPAVFGLTWIMFRDQSELDRIRTYSSRIIQDFLEEPGFISIVTGAAGDRAFTVTAWESVEALERALSKGHSMAKQDFRTGDLSSGVWTGVWKPEHINSLWYRCLSCYQPNDLTNNTETCANCGSPLHGRPAYW